MMITDQRTPTTDRAIVIGGGQSGLAAACALRTHGFQPVLLEAGPEPGGSWPMYYDSLVLFSPAHLNALPGLPFPGEPDHYPTRDQVIDYLRRYAQHLDCEIHTGRRATSVLCDREGFVVTTQTGETWHAPVVVSATGNFSTPYRPELGLAEFAGQVLHSSEYRNPAEFAGRRVVVVGAGNSGVQIAVELAETADKVTLVSRKPVKIADLQGMEVFWTFMKHLGHLPLGAALARSGLLVGQQVIDNIGGYRTALRKGKPTHRPLFTQASATHLHWPNGTKEEVDTIILATGFRPSLEHLRPLGALDRSGNPHHRNGLSTTHPGLAYVGLLGQRALYSAALGGAGWDACHVAKTLRRRLPRKTPACCAH
ncbi:MULTISPECIES: NAD(P)/FAD-dependent oxidoreductase [unclassified Crossiella]|uniref:flavin-containing monooxygenase n=1 Tax=unclassified Crossiella TaxID=2620835 RepID=UPI001FFF4244|nr:MULTISPECIES: NAD(P)/FAD-dependent oxidoreductase [unclassified Crossiella]MCK2242934.1 NAD(P)/FAD-dependent oxidoreductase [Crossiella sp. S99.2]MCK2256811.1 NAD(P)/FAD-dependent oxidoreductase [Crossiella sp. S99.1]